MARIPFKVHEPSGGDKPVVYGADTDDAFAKPRQACGLWRGYGEDAPVRVGARAGAEAQKERKSVGRNTDVLYTAGNLRAYAQAATRIPALGADSQRHHAPAALRKAIGPIAKAPQNGAFGAGAASLFHSH